MTARLPLEPLSRPFPTIAQALAVEHEELHVLANAVGRDELGEAFGRRHRRAVDGNDQDGLGALAGPLEASPLGRALRGFWLGYKPRSVIGWI